MKSAIIIIINYIFLVRLQLLSPDLLSKSFFKINNRDFSLKLKKRSLKTYFILYSLGLFYYANLGLPIENKRKKYTANVVKQSLPLIFTI